MTVVRRVALAVLSVTLLVMGTAVSQASAAASRTVAFDSIKTTSWETGTLRVTGRVSPAPPSGTRVYLQRWMPSTHTWRNIGLGYTRGGSAVTVTSRAAGSVLTYRLYAPASGAYAAAYSRQVRHQHFVWRGVFHKALLAKGGSGNPHFDVIPASDAPNLSQADLQADRGGQVWGDLNTSGCTRIAAFFANLTDGSVRVSLLRNTTAVATTTMAQETETDLNRTITGVTRLRMLVRDLGSGYGPALSTDTRTLCNN